MLNSHSHDDHVGDNWEFDTIYAMDTDFTRQNAQGSREDAKTEQDIAKSQIIAADSMAKLVGAGGITFIVATVMISTFGTLNATVLTAPRIFFAMAEDRLFFEPLARVHPRFKTPHVAVILSGALGILYVVVATALSGSKAFGP